MKLYSTLLISSCLMVGTLDATILSMKAKYRRVDLAPRASSQIDVVNNVPKLEKCLTHCFENEDCQCVLFESTTCHLYNTTNVEEMLEKGQTVIIETSRIMEHSRTSILVVDSLDGALVRQFVGSFFG